MVKFSLAVIDDEQTIREGISAALKLQYDIQTFASAEEALGEIVTSPTLSCSISAFRVWTASRR